MKNTKMEKYILLNASLEINHHPALDYLILPVNIVVLILFVVFFLNLLNSFSMC